MQWDNTGRSGLRARRLRQGLLATAILLAGAAPFLVRAQESPGGRPAVREHFRTVRGLEGFIATIKQSVQARQGNLPAPAAGQSRRVKGTGILEAIKYEKHLLSYPNDTWDPAELTRALVHREEMPPYAGNDGGDGPKGGKRAQAGGGTGGKRGGPVAGAVWEFVGPRNALATFGPSNSRISGRVNNAVFHPQNPSIGYLASAGGGIWKTTDGGQNWAPLNDNNLPTIRVSCLAVHPTRPDTILIGLGDYPIYHSLGATGRGLARSDDGGRTWSVVASSVVAGIGASAIVFDPENPDIITVSSGRTFSANDGIFRSTNGGVDWDRIDLPAGEWSSLVTGARDPATNKRFYYAALAGDSVYRSEDRGLTWTRLNVPLRFNGNPFTDSNLEVAASKVEPRTVYVLEGSAAALDGRLYKSFDAGNDLTWVDITGDHPRDNGDKGFNFVQVWYDIHLTPSLALTGAGVTDVLYTGLITLSGSLGGGTYWTDIGRIYINDPTTHPDQHGMAINPIDPNRVWITNDGGIYGYSFDPVAVRWTLDGPALNRTLGVTEFYAADWHPTNPDYMLGGTQDNSTPAALGDISNWVGLWTGDGFQCAIHPRDPNYQLATAQFNYIGRTTDGWNTAANMTPNFGADPVPFNSTVAMDPSNKEIIYTGSNQLYRYGLPDQNNDTDLWTVRLGGTVLTKGTQGAVITTIAVAPSDPRIVYVGSNDGAVWMTLNAKAQDANGLYPASQVAWRRIDLPTNSNNQQNGVALPNGTVLSIDINPQDPFDILVGIGAGDPNRLWRCANTAQAWQNPRGSWNFAPVSGIQGQPTALPQLAARCISRDPSDPYNTYYVGNDAGLFITRDAGSTWFNLGTSSGLPPVSVRAVKAVSTTGFLNVATYGRGMWRLPLDVPGPAQLKMSAAIARRSGTLVVTLKVTNLGGEARFAQLTQATMRPTPGTQTYNTTTALPLDLGTIATGATVTQVVTFPGTIARSGTFVTFSASATAQTLGGNKTYTTSLRTRLP